MQKNKQKKKKLEKIRDKLDPPQELEDKPAPKKRQSNEQARQALVERLIQEAMERGEFDNLPGAGKPLNLNDNPYLEPGQAWGFDLLKRNGFAPEWIERDKEIRKRLNEARHQLQMAWRNRLISQEKWHAAVARFEAQLNTINQKIDDFNLIAPVVSLQRSRLRVEDELERVKKDS